MSLNGRKRKASRQRSRGTNHIRKMRKKRTLIATAIQERNSDMIPHRDRLGYPMLQKDQTKNGRIQQQGTERKIATRHSKRPTAAHLRPNHLPVGSTIMVSSNVAYVLILGLVPLGTEHCICTSARFSHDKTAFLCIVVSCSGETM